MNNNKLILWSTTHIKCLLIVEKDWYPPPNDPLMTRHQLLDLMSPELTESVNQLACWVWQRRFTQSGFEIDLGGWMFLCMIQVCLLFSFFFLF
jgi:hypothetical protein